MSSFSNQYSLPFFIIPSDSMSHTTKQRLLITLTTLNQVPCSYNAHCNPCAFMKSPLARGTAAFLAARRRTTLTVEEEDAQT